MKVFCSSVNTRAFRCNMTRDCAFTVSDSKPLLREYPLCKRSTTTFAKRPLDGIRVRRRILAQAGTDALTPTPPEASPPISIEPGSVKGSLSIAPDAYAPLESAKEAENVASGVSQGGELPADLKSNISTLVDSTKQFSTDATEKATKTLNETSSLVRDKVDDFSNTLQHGFDKIAEEFAHKVDAANDAVGAAISSTEEASSQLLKQFTDSIPPEYKEYIDVAQSYASSVTEFASTYRVPLLVGTVAIFGYASFAFYKYRFTGYSGDVLPEKVLSILQNDVPALLVDVRSENTQQSTGVPKLRRKALGKAVSLPLCTPSTKPVRTLTSSSRESFIAITAAYISALTQATPATSFVILAENDSDGRDVARALEQNEGREAFVMLGGFEAWTNSGLPIGNAEDYDVTPVDAISDKAQEIVEPLTDPKLLAVTAVALTATGWSIWNYRYILRLLGVLGPTLTLIAYYIKKYDTFDDFVNDVKNLVDTEKLASMSSGMEARPQNSEPQLEETTKEEATEATSEINETSLAES